MWNEAADAFLEAEGRGPLWEYQSRLRIQALLAAGREEEARGVFLKLSDRSDFRSLSTADADFLPPNKTKDREGRLASVRTFAGERPTEAYRLHRLANACLRAGEFAEAETILNKLLADDRLYFHPLLATVQHYLGKADMAKKTLADAEEKYSGLVKDALAAKRDRTVLWWEDEMWYQVTLRKARRLIVGGVAGPTAEETTLMSNARAPMWRRWNGSKTTTRESWRACPTIRDSASTAAENSADSRLVGARPRRNSPKPRLRP